MPVQTITAADTALLCVFVYLVYSLMRRVASARITGPRPPGPPGIWFFGNAYQIPSDRQWLQFDDWTRTYGDVVQLTVTGQPILILGSMRAAHDLLHSRGTIYSDRPSAIMAGELAGWDRGLGYSRGPKDSRFREFRRLFHKFIGPQRVQEATLLATQERYSAKLLLRLFREPDAYLTHIRQSTGALLLHVAYGYDIKQGQKEDDFVRIAEVAMQGFSLASKPGAFLVDTLPWLKYVPAWVPGARFQRVARRMWEERERLYNVPFGFVKEQMKYNQAMPSFVKSYLEERGTHTDSDEEIIKAAAASLYSGGIASTPSSLSSFILAMTLYPEIQERAQAEIDSVLGKGWRRLPTFDDRQKLPYVNAIVLELLRWNPAVPLGLAHMLTQSDTYRGYHLPEGAIVWANIWSMLHDETVYTEPSEFRPERYLNADGSLRGLERQEDPALISFGFGRRICPGMYLAQNSIFIGICMILYVFDISMAIDGHGEKIVPQIEYDGFISYPRPFPCTIRPRSAEAETLITKTTVLEA